MPFKTDGDMEWDAPQIAKLTKLWNSVPSIPSKVIAQAMGISKNAVVGKAHRLGLPSRPSPIRRNPDAKPRVQPAPKKTLAPLMGPPLAESSQEAPNEVSKVVEPLAEPPPPPTKAMSRSLAVGDRVSGCCWPIGNPGQTSFRFCEAPTIPMRQYCQVHMSIAYSRMPTRQRP